MSELSRGARIYGWLVQPWTMIALRRQKRQIAATWAEVARMNAETARIEAEIDALDRVAQ